MRSVKLLMTCNDLMKTDKKWSSRKGRKGNALASGADEGRDKLREATGSGTYASIRGCPNGETRTVSHRTSYAE